LQTSSSYQKAPYDKSVSSKKGDKDQDGLNNRTSGFSTDSKTQGSSNAELSTKESPKDHPMEMTTHDQKHDLLGLALHNSTSQGVHSPSFEHVISICPVHSIAITDDHGDENFDASVTSSQQEAASSHAETHMPIERYLAEGVAERYAILSLEENGTERRGGSEGYSRGCLCGRGARL
jgi:hypothetical protein